MPPINVGLTSGQARDSFKQNGPNQTVVASPKLTAFEEFFSKFKSPLIILLLIIAAISFGLGQKIDATIIIIMVGLSGTLDFFNSYKSEQAAAALQHRVKVTVQAWRDGQLERITLEAVVPGDIIELIPGNIIPADGKITSSNGLSVDESSLTGEAFPQPKTIDSPVSMGSSVVTGEGRMLVIATGGRTHFSKITRELSAKDSQTDFDRGIQNFSHLILKIIFVFVLLIFLLNTILQRDLLESFFFAIALAVGLTPELLPVIITVTLARGALAMSKHGVIIKKLSSIQNFGSMDVLCTDKTGTLTENKIALVSYVDGYGKVSDDVLALAYVGSYFETGLKNPLDDAVLAFRHISVVSYTKLDEIAFDYERRRSSVVLKKSGRIEVISKGAPEDMVSQAQSYGAKNEKLTAKMRTEFQKTYQKLSDQGYRVLAVAKKNLAKEKKDYTVEDESDLTLIGFIAFLDPPKQTVKQTLRDIEKYGVEIKVLTGDNELVSQRIASQLELPIKGVLVGSQLAKLSDAALRERSQNITIFARLDPDQKRRVIMQLQAAGNVVGYLGDGINDAQSLKAADVGISVNNAVDVAKESADIILLEKSLKQLINGVIEGRKTFTNTMKYIMMSLSSNFGNIFSMAGASLFLPFLPMLPLQILLNNLLYDTSQFTLPLDNVDIEDIQKPRKWDINFIKRFIFSFGPISSIFDFLTFGLLLYVFHLGESGFQTGWFLESLATQALVVYFIRSRKLSFRSSRPALPIVASTLLVVAASVLLVFSPLGLLFKFTAPSLIQLLAIGAIVLAYFGAIELAKSIFFRRANLANWSLKLGLYLGDGLADCFDGCSGVLNNV